MRKQMWLCAAAALVLTGCGQQAKNNNTVSSAAASTEAAAETTADTTAAETTGKADDTTADETTGEADDTTADDTTSESTDSASDETADAETTEGTSDADGTKSAKTDSDELVEVTVILDYVANTNHTGMYVALDQGMYEAEGLKVNIVEPTEGATATLIAVGKGDFGISYQEDVTIALASKDPLPIKAIATIIQHNTSGFVTAADKDITSPKDFEGKTYAGWGGPGESAVLEAVMKQAGADFSKLNMVISDGSGFVALESNVDIMWFFEGWDNIKCKLADFPINYMELRQLDERLDYYTPVIITNNELAETNPDLVKRFLKATSEGYEYAIENPEECAEILHKYAPDYDMDLLTESQKYLAGKYAEDADRWGEMKDEVWDNYTEFMVEYGVIDAAIPASDCYTNEFLPE